MQWQAGSRASYQLEPSMDTCRAAMTKPDDADDADDADELGVFAAERYFYGDDDDALWPWAERSSSSLSSSAFRTGTHDHGRSVPTPTAVTSSSEASWNSRSALLPIEPAVNSHAVAVAAAAAAATPIVEARPSDAQVRRTGRRPASSSSSNQLRRWLLGVAACACAGGASEDSVSADEMATIPEGELSRPVLHPQAAATSDSDERRRIKSLEMLRLKPVGDHGSALGSAMQSSAFTIVAGNTAALGGDGDAPAPRAASSGGSGGSPGEDDAAPSELGCAYPPSEASVVWSVVTADGAASGNISSAASGYHHYHYCFNDIAESAMRRAAARNSHRRRNGIAGGSSLLMCLSEKAVDAVGPARSVHRQEVKPAAVATMGASGGSRNGHAGVYKPTGT